MPHNIQDAREFLRKLPFFTNTPLEVIKLYAYLSKRELYKKDAVILKQGNPCNRFLLIMSGEVEICQELHDKRFHLQTLSADTINYFGELALLAQFNWFFSAVAATDVAVLSIARKDFRKVMERFPNRYAKTVERIIKLRINRFINQTDYLLTAIETNTLKACPEEKSD